jgi:hypothetical protein
MEQDAPETKKISIVDDEVILQEGFADVPLENIPRLARSYVKRTGLVKSSPVLDEIRARFEEARALGPTTWGAAGRPTAASELRKLSQDLASVEVPEVEFDSEAKRLTEACTGYSATPSNWMKASATVVQTPKEPLDALYAQCLRVVRGHGEIKGESK